MKTVTVKGKVYQIGAIYWCAGEYLELVGGSDEGGFELAYPDKSASNVGSNCIKIVENDAPNLAIRANVDTPPG